MNIYRVQGYNRGTTGYSVPLANSANRGTRDRVIPLRGEYPLVPFAMRAVYLVF